MDSHSYYLLIRKKQKLVIWQIITGQGASAHNDTEYIGGNDDQVTIK